MTLEVKKVWMCSVCESVHDEEWQAEECCPPEVWEMYQCPVCDEVFDDSEDAQACCLEVEEDLSTGQYRTYPRDSTLNANRYIEQFILMNKYVN